MVRMVRMVRSLADRTFQLCLELQGPEDPEGADVVAEVAALVAVLREGEAPAHVVPKDTSE